MKIGILTYTREYANLGTNMQCYCTFKSVQQAFPNDTVEVIDYSPAAPARRPYLSHISVGSMRKDYVRMRRYDDFFKQHLTFSSTALVSSSVSRGLDFIRRQHYDAIYVGADTVLELKGAGADSLTPFWLDRTVPGVKVLAAASAHNITFEGLSEQQKALMERAVGAFSMLGVRDHATLRLLAQFAGTADERLELIPDPTFTYDIDYSHIERYFATKGLRLDRPLVCLHLVKDSTWAQALADRFRQAGYLVASLRPARYADIIFTDLSPFEQLGLYRHFSLMVTHRFHDAIFCLKNLTPVIAFPENVGDVTPAGESKIATLLRAFGVERTSYIADKSSITADVLFQRHWAAMAHFKQNRAEIERVLSEHRQKYKDFIMRSAAIVQ